MAHNFRRSTDRFPVQAARFSYAALALLLASGHCLALDVSDASEPKRSGVVHTPSCATYCDHGSGLPGFDIRVEDAALAIYNAAQRELTMARSLSTADLKAKRSPLASLVSAIPGLAIDWHYQLATPHFIRSTSSLLTGPRAGVDGRTVISDFVTANSSWLGFGPDELKPDGINTRLVRDYPTDHNGVRHMTFQQVLGGLDIVGAELRVNLTSSNELINLGSTMLGRGAVTNDAFTLTPDQAIVMAAASIGIPVDIAQLAEIKTSGATEEETPVTNRVTWTIPPELRADEPLVTERVYFPISGTILRPAYTVVVAQRGVGHIYDVTIDAIDGSVLFRQNRLLCAIEPVTMRVYTGNSPAPLLPSLSTRTGFQAPVVARELVTVNPADVAVMSPLGWINDGGTETLGNNVDAHTDTNNDNIADLPRPDGGASRVFDFALDLAQEPSAYRDAAVAQMFYLCNLYHDRLYSMGFNEAAGNFQNDNLGRGGAANDRIQADVQDGGGTNNANFSTSGTDGSSARCQMYIWSGPTPDRDGAFDVDIVYHELTHGTSIRLHRGLFGTQATGMGEGWSDYVGIALGTTPNSDLNASYSTGAYATNSRAVGFVDNYYYGIRRYPYSTNFNINPLTYADIDTGQFSVPASVPRNPLNSAAANQVHNVGEVWCSILNEGRAALSTVMSSAAANTMMLQRVIDGMKLSPSSPTFVQARDSILQAETVAGGQYREQLWTAFAKRGLGFGATAPAVTTTAGVVESYVIPTEVNFSFPGGLPTQLSPGVATTFPVHTTLTGLTLTSSVADLNYQVNGGAWQQQPLTPTGTDDFIATIPAQSCFANVNYYITLSTSVGNRTSPAAAPTTFYTAAVFTSTVTVITDSFETNTGWTVGPNSATTGLWVRADPIGTTAQPADARSGAGTLCFFTGQGTVAGALGEADVDGGETLLTSPAYNLSAYNDARVNYWRWYSNGLGGSPFADTFKVLVSTNNGLTWTAAETVGPSSSADTQPGWRFASWTLSSLGLTPTAQVRVRFIADDLGTGSIIEAAIDDFSITATACANPGPTACALADIASDSLDTARTPNGSIGPEDLDAFISGFISSNAAIADVASDSLDSTFNPNGSIGSEDLDAFIASFLLGC